MTTNTNTSVLVVMPVYNALPYLAEAVASVFNQTYSDFRFLIVDDSSTDGSYEYLISQQDERIQVIQQEHTGPGAAMNLALTYAQKNNFTYIARMDADDISSPQRLEIQLKKMEANLALAVVSCNCEYIDLKGKVIGKSTVPISSKRITWEIRNRLRGLIQGACLFRTSALVSVGGYNPNIFQAEDTDLFLRLSESFQFSNLPEVCYQIRINPLSLSMSNSEQNIRYFLYVHNCFARRNHGLPEMSFIEYCDQYSLTEKMRFYNERLFLKLWRKGMQLSSPFYKLLAGVISPKRVMARLLRLFEIKSQE